MKNKFGAFVVGRRVIAAAIFKGQNLHFWEVRSFHAKAEQAVSAVTGFVNYIVERCEIETAGLHDIQSPETRMATLTTLVAKLLKERGIPIITASEETLFSSFSYPPVPSRALLRDIALLLFPQLRTQSFGKEVLDAATLGLYLQTERILTSDLENT